MLNPSEAQLTGAAFGVGVCNIRSPLRSRTLIRRQNNPQQLRPALANADASAEATFFLLMAGIWDRTISTPCPAKESPAPGGQRGARQPGLGGLGGRGCRAQICVQQQREFTVPTK